MDVGSSSTRTALFSSKGAVIRGTESHTKYSIRYGDDGAAELSAEVLWRAVSHCVRRSRKKQTRINAIGISAFWHGLLGLDKQWRPITPIYTWADSRAAKSADELQQRLGEREVHARTGCRLHPSYWPAKLFWLRKSSPTLFRRVRYWVSPADWIAHKLVGSNATSLSMASGTGLLNLARLEWDRELCRALRISAAALPAIAAGAEIPIESRTGFGQTALHILGDGAASNLGSGASRRGTVAVNIGTSAAVRSIDSRSRRRVHPGLFRYLLDRDRTVVGGAISNAGNLRDWALRELQIDDDEKRAERRLFARDAASRDSLTVLPFWVNERAPTWPRSSGGVIRGLTPTT